LQYLVNETSVWTEITTLLIPGENDSDAELDKLSSWIVEHLGVQVPLHFSAFYPSWKMMDYPSTSVQSLQRAREIAIRNGLRYVYTGNIYNPQGDTTFCHVCGKPLIERNGYTLTGWALDAEACCQHCHTPLAGVFEAVAGDWGNRRLAIEIQQ